MFLVDYLSEHSQKFTEDIVVDDSNLSSGISTDHDADSTDLVHQALQEEILESTALNPGSLPSHVDINVDNEVRRSCRSRNTPAYLDVYKTNLPPSLNRDVDTSSNMSITYPISDFRLVS